MFETKQSPAIDQIVDAIIEEGGVEKLIDEAQLAIHVFSKNEIDIVDVAEGAINMWTNAEGQDVYACTAHADEASIHLFFAGTHEQILDRLFTLHLRVIAEQQT
jgi:hypothetical protein